MQIILVVVASLLGADSAGAVDWSSDPVWYDGLVEKATYRATRVVYGRPREYQAIFFTNKEQHDAKTLTKAHKSTDTIEVWKHNQVEVIPTPNYDYKYVTTTHLTTDGMELTRLDCSSQEFCGTSFKQYLRDWPKCVWRYWSFSYLPEEGRQSATIEQAGRTVMAEDSLPLFLRGVSSTGITVWLVPTQKNNRQTPFDPVDVHIKHRGDDGALRKFEVRTVADQKLLGTYWMAKDRLHVMTKYVSGDGSQTYELEKVERVNYWTRNE